MTTFIHDIDLGPKPDAHNQHRILANGKGNELLLTIMHHIRDEAAHCSVRAAEATRDGRTAEGQMELGANDILVQVFTRINNLRNEPLEIEPSE